MEILLTIILALGIPESHLDGLNGAYFHDEPGYYIASGSGEERRRWSAYFIAEKEIHVYEGAETNNIVHEIGHHVCEWRPLPKFFGRGEMIHDISFWAPVDRPFEDCAYTYEQYYMGNCLISPWYRKAHPMLFKKCVQIKKWHRRDSRKN